MAGPFLLPLPPASYTSTHRVSFQTRNAGKQDGGEKEGRTGQTPVCALTFPSLHFSQSEILILTEQCFNIFFSVSVLTWVSPNLLGHYVISAFLLHTAVHIFLVVSFSLSLCISLCV